MIASVPLIVEGYPMINVEPEKREEYHWGNQKGELPRSGSREYPRMPSIHPGVRRGPRTVDEILRRWHAENS